MVESIFFNPWVWIIPIILGIALLLTVLGIVLIWADDFSVGGPVAICFGGGTLLILGGVYFGFMLPPYDSSFYHTYRITGEVSEIQSAFEGDDGTMSQTFIIKVDGVDEVIKSEDQRMRLIDTGDEINFVCYKSFAYFQDPWYSCDVGVMVKDK